MAHNIDCLYLTEDLQVRDMNIKGALKIPVTVLGEPNSQNFQNIQKTEFSESLELSNLESFELLEFSNLQESFELRTLPNLQSLVIT